MLRKIILNTRRLQQEVPQCVLSLSIQLSNNPEKLICLRNGPGIRARTSLQILDGPRINVFQENLSTDGGVGIEDVRPGFARMVADEAVGESGGLDNGAKAAVAAHGIDDAGGVSC